MKRSTAAELLHLLGSSNPQLVKRGLQRICDALEAGHRIDLERNRSIALLIAKLKGSNDIDVRRWLYKLIGLLRDTSYIPYLRGQVEHYERDPENLSWATGALIALEPSPRVQKLLSKAALEFHGTPLELAARYFRPGGPLPNDLVKKILSSGETLSSQWLSLLYGKRPGTVHKDVVVELNRHPERHVSEYSIWAIFRDDIGGIQDLTIYPQDVVKAPENVRRWYYRLLVKDPRNLVTYHDLVEYAISEDQSPVAREGLALGLVDVYGGSQFAREVIEWFHKERNHLVRMALMRHFVRFAQRNRDYRNLLVDELRIGAEVEFPGVLESKPNPRSVFLLDRTSRGTEEYWLTTIPRITRTMMEHAYILGIDTVDFSDKSDSQQLQIFEDLLSALADTDIARRVNPDDLICLLTGDGLFACFRQVDNRHAPLYLALSIQSLYGTLRTYKLRFGINSGPAAWIELSDGSRQLIAHAINWTARVMSAASENRIFVSSQYYETMLRGARDQFPAHEFQSVEGLFTKKGEPIPAYEVRQR